MLKYSVWRLSQRSKAIMGSINCKGLFPANSGKQPTATGMPEKHDYVEGVVCEEKDINENEMKLLPLGDDGGKILLIKQKGQLHAIGTKCTHYGALLHTGALGEGRVRCPWHGACFNIKTGDIEDYPGLDSLPCYKVNVDEGGLVHVRAKRTDLEVNKRTKEMCKYNSDNHDTVVIVGGGPAGATCAESLRQEGFSGRIVLVCKEDVLPYDRVKVSKAMDFDIGKAALRPATFYSSNSIDVKLGVTATDRPASSQRVNTCVATALNTAQNVVRLSNDESLAYNHLFICTGSKARMPNIPGIDLFNIYVMRDYTDSHAVHSKLSPEKHVVILGLGFIAIEAAAYMVGKCASITVIGRDTVPLRHTFGSAIGNRVRTEHESKGIKFIFQSNILKFLPKQGEENILGSVELLDGSIILADIVIVGIGSTLYTDWIEDSAVQKAADGSIIVDQYLKTSVDNVYAGGDIAYAPLFGRNDFSATIGHYALAHYHGKVAAANICANRQALNAVPFFWTTLFGKSYRYAGYGKPSKIRIHGSLDNLEFFAYYIKDNKVIAMSSVGADPIVSDYANLLYEGRFLTEEEISKNPFGWISSKPKDLEKRFQTMQEIDLN